MLAMLVAVGLWLAPAPFPGAAAQAGDAPAATSASASQTAIGAFDPLIGKTWRGVSLTDPAVVDELVFEPVVGGKAVRSRHSVNGGAYMGETLIAFDPDQGRLVTFYATNGGFYTTGTVEVLGPGAFAFDQKVHGLKGVEAVRATTSFTDGIYRIRSQHLINGSWVDTGGFDYHPVP